MRKVEWNGRAGVGGGREVGLEARTSGARARQRLTSKNKTQNKINAIMDPVQLLEEGRGGVVGFLDCILYVAVFVFLSSLCLIGFTFVQMCRQMRVSGVY